MADPTYNAFTNQWDNIPSKTTKEENFVCLVLDNGCKILSFGDSYSAGSDVHVIDQNNREVAMWVSDEWEAKGEGELVMGAILRAVTEL